MQLGYVISGAILAVLLLLGGMPPEARKAWTLADMKGVGWLALSAVCAVFLIWHIFLR
jgi:hypothetical protein